MDHKCIQSTDYRSSTKRRRTNGQVDRKRADSTDLPALGETCLFEFVTVREKQRSDVVFTQVDSIGGGEILNDRHRIEKGEKRTDLIENGRGMVFQLGKGFDFIDGQHVST